MPMIIHVGKLPAKGFLEPATKRVLEKVLPAANSEPPQLELAIAIPSIFGILVLDEVAASLAMGDGLPEPHRDHRGLAGQALRLENKIQDEGFRPLHDSVLLRANQLVCVPRMKQEILAALGKRRSRIESVLDLREELEALDRALAEVQLPQTLGELRMLLAGTTVPDYCLEKFVVAALLEACRFSIVGSMPLWLEWTLEMKPKDRVLLDQAVILEGFYRFRESEVLDAGRAISVSFDSGYRYRLTAVDVASWFPGEASGRFESAEVVAPDRTYVSCRFERGQVLLSHAAVLEKCEPSYELFDGGDRHRPEERRERSKREGSFRLFP